MRFSEEGETGLRAGFPSEKRQPEEMEKKRAVLYGTDGGTGALSDGIIIALTDEEEIIMDLGNSLFHARKRCGLSQEAVAEKLGVSRQTISKWETGETLPDIRQSKKMAVLYGISLDELIAFDVDVKEIQEVIDRTSEETEEKVDWTKAWGKKYPILLRYGSEVNIPNYARRLTVMLEELKEEYHYSELDAMLVLKDILYSAWKRRKNFCAEVDKQKRM